MDIRRKKACNLYNTEIGCPVHENRPLACRLFPLGRQIQENEVHYFYQGKSFPCLDGCKEVLDLPQLTVEKYLSGQQTFHFESAQNLYLEVMQNTADIAFMLLLETDLIQSEKEKTWLTWKKIAHENIDDLILRISPDWLDALIAPPIEFDIEDPTSFVHQHEIHIQNKAQEIINQFKEGKQACDLSIVLFTSSLILAQSIGAEAKSIANLWVKIAQENLD
jgi:Fe-S-cluster containining protein